MARKLGIYALAMLTLLGIGVIVGNQSIAATSQPAAVTDNVRDARGLDQALERLHVALCQTPALSPQEELKTFHARPGLALDLIAHEPDIRQPLCINFDERGGCGWCNTFNIRFRRG